MHTKGVKETTKQSNKFRTEKYRSELIKSQVLLHSIKLKNIWPIFDTSSSKAFKTENDANELKSAFQNHMHETNTINKLFLYEIAVRKR